MAATPATNYSRGFDPAAKYLVPVDDDPARGWVTQIYDGLNPEVVVEPKGERKRLLIVGGSNVQRFPAEHLAETLEAASSAAHPGWEAINIGREGYGSERVSILLQQALVIEPDVVVIYAGHNEFLERRFADEVADSLSFSERAVIHVLSHLRTFRLIEELASDKPAPLETTRSDDQTPEEYQFAGNSFRDIHWGATLRYLEAYRRNLTRMIEAAKASGARVIIGTLVNNDLAPPVQGMARRELDKADRAKLAALRHTSILEEPDNPWAALRKTRLLRWPQWTGRRELPKDYTPPQLRPLSGALAATPATRGPLDSVEGAHWSDPVGWSHQTANVLAAYKQLLDRAPDERWRAICREHVERSERVLEIAPDDSFALYDLGLSLWLLGEDDTRAVTLLRAAAAADRVPVAANDTINAIVREVAAATDTALVDLDALFRERSPDGLVAFEIVKDHCHLQPGAAHVLLEDIAEGILAMND